MARWRQDAETGKLVPIEENHRRTDGGACIHGDIQAFVSPVDGTVISDRKQLREHNKRNNVVNTEEFSQSFWDKKAKERADFYNGVHTREETLVRKREIYENIMRLEREG